MFGPSGGGDASAVVAAIYHCLDVWNCRIINLSLGVPEQRLAQVPRRLELMRAVEEAYYRDVLVIAAAWEMGKIGYGRHAPDPIVDIIDAKGTFHYLQGGRVVKGKWKKGAVNKRFSFTLADGSPLLMAPGRTWVEMPSPSADLRIG